jgi:hypothetical protein
MASKDLFPCCQEPGAGTYPGANGSISHIHVARSDAILVGEGE